MQAFRKQINESFFNPLLHFIPLLLFILINSNFGSSVALSVVYFSVVSILVYSYFLYANIYKYLGVSYLVSTIIIAFIIFYPEEYIASTFKPVFSELVTVTSFLLLLILRRKITEFVSSVTPRHVAMTNNLDEHFRIVLLLVLIMSAYIIIYFISQLFLNISDYFFNFVRNVYWGVLFFVMFYEFIRVTMVRIRLSKEEWWPIVNEQGKLIGSIQREESITAVEKHIHPIIRVILINDSKIFLQKKCLNEKCDAGLWDVTLSNHIRMNETVEQCIQRTAYENYNQKDIKPVLLSKFLHATNTVIQFEYLFKICNLQIVNTNPDLIDSVKWWTFQQIDANIGSGIFTQSFEKEYEILKRSGLLENGKYQCNCHLKEVVYEGIIKKSS